MSLLPVGWQELRLRALLVQQVLVHSITSLALGLWRGINKAMTVSRRYLRKSKLWGLAFELQSWGRCIWPRICLFCFFEANAKNPSGLNCPKYFFHIWPISPFTDACVYLKKKKAPFLHMRLSILIIKIPTWVPLVTKLIEHFVLSFEACTVVKNLPQDIRNT